MTVEKIAWIVGVSMGTMFESEEAWAKKLRGSDRQRRYYRARRVCFLVLHEICGVSYREISRVFNRRDQSVVGRGLAQARLWREESPENRNIWVRIETAVRESIAAEQAHHAHVSSLKIGATK